MRASNVQMAVTITAKNKMSHFANTVNRFLSAGCHARY